MFMQTNFWRGNFKSNYDVNNFNINYPIKDESWIDFLFVFVFSREIKQHGVSPVVPHHETIQ